MLEMKSRSALIALFAGTALAVVACGEDDGNGDGTNTDPTATVNPTGTDVSPTGTGVSPTGTDVSPTGTGVNPTVDPGGVNPTVDPAVNPTVSPTTEPMCEAPPATPPEVMINANYGFGDETTTYDVTAPTPGTLCLSGTAVSSDNGEENGTYANWGAGLGLQLGTDDDTGYDAAALNIAGVQFELTEVSGRPVRVQMTLANIPEITTEGENFSANAYSWGSSSNPKNTTTAGAIVVPFSDMVLPSWSMIPDMYQADLDATRLNALQLQIANEPSDMEEPYNFCVTKLEWINECGDVVAVSTLPEPGDDTPAPDGDSGAPVDTTDMMEGDAGTMDTTDPEGDAGGGDDTTDMMSTGEDTTDTMPVELSFADDVHPILLAKCGECHGAGQMMRPAFAVDDAAAAQSVAEGIAATIKVRIQSDGADKMPREPAEDLTADEEATLVEWVDSLSL